ncbi:MAG TPA: response regulator [Methylomirabilota bacterium]|nr:response regulator [Methylomirabilota bacterium]
MRASQWARKDTVEMGDRPAVYRPRPVVLAIDDEAGVRESLQLILRDEFEVLEAPDGEAALAILATRRVDVALLDVRMPGEPGSKVLPRILAIDESIPVILITADPHLRMAVDAMKAGAYDYLAKPFDVDEILGLVRQAAQQRGMERELHYLRAEFDRVHGFDQLIGRHPKMVRLYELIAQVAQTPATVLITAPVGTPLAQSPVECPLPRQLG